MGWPSRAMEIELGLGQSSVSISIAGAGTQPRLVCNGLLHQARLGSPQVLLVRLIEAQKWPQRLGVGPGGVWQQNVCVLPGAR